MIKYSWSTLEVAKHQECEMTETKSNFDRFFLFHQTWIPKYLSSKRVYLNLMLIFTLSLACLPHSIISFVNIDVSTSTYIWWNHFSAAKIESFHLVNWFDTAFMIMYHSSFVVGMWSKLTTHANINTHPSATLTPHARIAREHQYTHLQVCKVLKNFESI